MARSYIKIYGPPLLKSLRSLEKVAVEFSNKTTMRYYSAVVPSPPQFGTLARGSDLRQETVLSYTQGILTEIDMSPEDKIKLISRSGDLLGDYDFFFEWGKEPTKQEVQELIAKIDETLADCGCRYSIVTK